MSLIKIYIKRKELRDMSIEVPSDIQKLHLLIFLLERELRLIKRRLRSMEKKGEINNISLPRKDKAKDLVKSRTSIIKALRVLRKV